MAYHKSSMVAAMNLLDQETLLAEMEKQIQSDPAMALPVAGIKVKGLPSSLSVLSYPLLLTLFYPVPISPLLPPLLSHVLS